jgi:uncharacterized protein YqeY
MSLKAQINEDMKTAMRAKDKERLGAIRLILAAIKQREVDERIELSDSSAWRTGENDQAAPRISRTVSKCRTG